MLEDVEAFLDQKQENWIAAHVNLYRFLGGVTKLLVPDNLKTGVEKPDRYSPTINKTYHEMAEHYDTVVLPARVSKPKDKPSAEGAVGDISSYIIAALRHQKFFSRAALNHAIQERLDAFNRKPFQKREGSIRVEAACKKALFYTPMPSFKSVKTILSTGQDKVETEPEPVTADNVEAYGFTRGASYYGRTTR